MNCTSFSHEVCISSAACCVSYRSSTESEIIGADDFMPAICWTRYFMEAQGYQVQDNILFQDNNSTILLEKNGKASSSKHTKHVNIRYFFITNRIDKGNVIIGLVSNWRHDQRLHDQAPARCSVPEVQRPNHGSGSCTGSRTRKSHNEDR